nr:hypothetical protein [Tanacetum cinerariifolium]
MDSLSPHVVSAAKVPILNPNEFDFWKMRIEQYFLMTDYSLWGVILNGDSPVPTRVVDGIIQPVALTITEQKLAKKNELKARGTLLITLTDKHLLKFNSHKDAKTLMEAIKKRFRGNIETKKVQKILLKLQYENFTGSHSESLDQIHDRLQKLVSQLEIHVVSLSQEDVNLNTTESVSATASVFAVSAKMPMSSIPNVESLGNAIDVVDLEEMDLRWQMAKLTIRARRFLQKTCINLGVNGPTSMGFDMSKVECYNCHRKGHFAKECRSPKDSRRNEAAEPQRRNVPVETSTSNAFVSQCDGVGSYDWSYQAEEEPANYTLMAFSSSSSSPDNEQTCIESVEAILLVYKQNEYVFEENIKLPNIEVQLRDNSIVTLRQKLEKEEQEMDDLKLKFQPSDGYHVVPPPYTGTFMPPKPDLGFNITPSAFETDHPAFTVQLSPTKPEQDLSHTNRPTTPIIKDWVSDSEDKFETKAPQIVPSFFQSFEQVKSPRHYVQHVETSIPAATSKPASPKSASSGKKRNRKACFVCKSLDHLIKDCDFHAKKMAQPTPWNHAHWGHHKQYALLTHTNPQKHMVHAAVLTQSKPIYITAVRPVSADVPKIKVTRPRHANLIVTKSKSPIRRHITRSLSPKTSNSPPRVPAVKAPMDKELIDSGCSRNMKGNMSYLFDFEELNSGYVAFGGNPKGVSHKCVTRRIVTDTECLVLSLDFKLPDESQVLLRVPRENNMYNVNLKNIVLSEDLTCLFAKETIDESNLWHRRLAHINFKTINKLVKGNLVRGLPTKFFENDHTCVSCKKGKQHRASCKTKPVSSVNQPLYRLQMDLFGPTFIKSMNKKTYCLVVTDDYSSLKVKVNISDNETEFKNHNLDQFCGMKEIKREFSVPRTPQQNGIAERKNRTLIEVARTMLADSLLPIPFWAEAVNTACYVQNRVLVTKPHNKTPCELLHGKTPSIGFMRPFGRPVTILNTLDSLGKFKGKVDEGVMVGDSVNSNAFRVFNSRTRIVQETLHVNFLENKPNVACFQDKFDAEKEKEVIDQQYMLFPVWSSGSTNPQNNDGDIVFDGNEHDFDAKKPESEVSVSLSSNAQSRKQDDKTKKEAKGKSLVESFIGYKDLSVEFKDYSVNSINEVNAAGTIVPTVGQNSPNSTNTFSAAGHSNAASPTYGKSSFIDASQLPDDPDMPELEDITYSDDEDDVGAEADFNNLKTSITVSPIPTTRVHKDHPVSQIIGDLSLTTKTRSMIRVEEPKRIHQALKNLSWIEAMHEELLQFKMQKEEGIDYEEVFAPVTRIEAIRLFLAYVSFMGFMVYQMDVKSAFLYRTIEKEVYDYQPPGFEDPDHPDKVYKVVKAFYGLHQALRAWYETLANYLLENSFQKGKIDQTLFIKRQKGGILLCKKQTVVATSSTEAEYVAAASCCAQVLWIQNQLLDYGPDQTVSSKDSSNSLMADNLPKIVWYSTHHITLNEELESPKANDSWANDNCDSPLLGVNTPRSDEDRLELMELTVFLLPKVEKVGIGVNAVDLQISAVRHMLLLLQALVDRKKVVVTEATIREALHLDDAEGVDCLPNEEIFKELARMGYEKPSTKLTLVRNVDSTTKFYMYPHFLQLIIRKQVGDLSTHTTKYTFLALTQKVFANIKRVGKGFSGVETPLFEGMLVEHEIDEEEDAAEHVEEVNTGDAAKGDDSAAHGEVPTVAEEQSISSPTPPTPPPQPPQDLPSTSQVQQTPPQSPQEGEETREKEQGESVEDQKGRMIAEMDQDDVVVLEDDKEEDKDVADGVKDVEKAKVDENETEPAKVQEVVDVVTTAKLITEVVTAASETVTATSTIVTTAEAQVPTATTATLTAAPSKDKGKGILVEEPKPLKKKQQIKQDEQYARELHAKLNKDIDWDEAIDYVKLKAKEDPAVKRYQAIKRKPRTEAQARKNMVMYLKNVVGFKLDYFKGMSYDDIRLIFEVKFNSNVAFLLKTKEQIEEDENRALQTINETPTVRAAKMRKLDEEVEDLKRHL